MKPDWIKKFFIGSGVWLIIVSVAAYYFFGLERFWAAPAGMLMLLAGFKITELLVAIFTKQRSANSTAIALLFLAKFVWWAGIFIASRHMTDAQIAPLGLGFAGFFCALCSVVVSLFGWPKISPAKQSGDS